MIIPRKSIVEKLRTTASYWDIHEATSDNNGISNYTGEPIPEDEIEKLKEMGMEDKTAVIKNINGDRQYFHNIHLGKNGPGDFVEDDLQDLIDKLRYMKGCGASEINMTEGKRDILDDVSSWSITFGIK